MLPATIVSIKQAFQEIKHFCVDAWEGDYRPAARQALKEILETRYSIMSWTNTWSDCGPKKSPIAAMGLTAAIY